MFDKFCNNFWYSCIMQASRVNYYRVGHYKTRFRHVYRSRLGNDSVVFIAHTILDCVFCWFRGGGKVPKLGYVFNICYALQTPKPNPPPPNVQIYSPNLFLNYYIFILFYFISLALTKLDFLERPA